MRPAKLLALASVAILAPAAVVVTWGLVSLAQEAERAQARYREQASACARAVEAALLAVAGDLADHPEALAFRADTEGTLFEPVLEPRALASDDFGLIGSVRAEIDALERDGELDRARARLRELSEQSERPGIAAWALTTIAAIEQRAGRTDEARAARLAIVERFPDQRDERGLLRAHAARFALAQTPADWLALLADLDADRTSLEHTAPAALADRVAEKLRGVAPDALAPLERAQRERLRGLRLIATWRSGVSDWLARGALGGQRIFELAPDPLRPERALVFVLALADGGGWRGVALEVERIAAAALARPEIGAWNALRFRAAIEHGELGHLGGDAAPADTPVAQRALAAPFETLSASAFGTDFEGFLAGERRRFALIASLSAAALLIAAVAAFATVRAVAREARAAQSRQDFVAAVTHELKAPLASIRLLAELLERGGVDEPKVREFGARTVAESDRLTRLVSSVLELARIEHGANGRVRERVDLVELARDVVAVFDPRASARGFAVELRAVEQPVFALAERDALHNALSELLDNALVHATEPHALEVEIGAHERRATIAVLDRGPGVPASERQRVFEPFHRVGDELTRERPGVGLGLALVARIVAAHGGSVRCEAREGGGSRFVIELPAALEVRGA